MGGRWGWLGAGCGLLCAAAQAAALNEADFLAEIPMVLTPSRLSQTQADSPSAVTVIDRDMIRAAGITQLPDALRMVPGFVVARRDGLSPTATYPGFGDGFARRFQVLIDGRSVYSPDFGQVYWRNLPVSLEDVDRIEVIRGPAAASYGANAFFGVINILTRSDEGGTRAGVMVGAGERSYRELNARVGTAGDAGHWRLSVGQRDDDYYEADDFGPVADDVRDQFADGRGDWYINDTDTLSVMGGVANTRLDEDIDAGQTFPVKVQSGYGQLIWQRVYESGAETRLAYNYTQQSYSDRLDLGVQPLDLGFSTRRQNLTAAWNGALSESIRVALGAEYRMDEVESDFYYNQAESIEENSWRVYGNGEFRLAPEWLVNAGAMLESTQASEEEVSPRLTLHYQPHLTQSFRIAYNLGYRVPTFYELYGENVLDFGFGPDTLLILPDTLESERIVSREIGWWQAWPAYGLTLDMRAFYDDYTNLIDFTEVPFPDGQDDLAYQFFNAGDATVKGLEFQFEWKPAARTRVRFAPSWVRIRADNPEWEESAPSYAFNLLAEHGFNQNWWISGLWNRNAGFRWLGDGDAIDGANRLDLRLAWRGSASGTPLEVALIGRHLLGGEAEYVPTRETEGQQVLVQFRAGF